MTATKANRNTWWMSRPKRSLAPAPGTLRTLVDSVAGDSWRDENQTTQRAFEHGLEDNELKASRSKRDPNGGGPRTYLAWLRSLGLLWIGNEHKLYLTLAGEAIVKGDERLMEIMSRQVLHYQFPSYFTSGSGASSVSQRFQVRPFVFLLQLLLDPRLDGYLTQKDDVAKIVLCFGEDNTQQCVDDVVERILAMRDRGNSSLPDDYLERFQSNRSKEETLDKLFKNLNHIANTAGNWLSHTQLVHREHGGPWTIADGAEAAAREAVDTMLAKPLISDWNNQERFQRKYGLTPGRKKDLRDVEAVQNIGPEAVQEQEIIREYTTYSTTNIVTEITDDLVISIASKVAAEAKVVRKVLLSRFKSGYGGFLMRYTELAQDSRKSATKFEKATAEIFDKVFGFQAKHIGAQALRPDVVIHSRSDGYGAILDTKAYGKAYTLAHDQRGVMRNYIDDYSDYQLDEGSLAFFAYVVGTVGPNMDAQIAEVSRRSDNVPGSAVTAHDLVLMVKRHLGEKPYSHKEIRELFSRNRVVEVAGNEHSLDELVAAASS
ncbi:restriction endonuclease FokI C-terminal domain-containing protein [Brevibacterium sp. CBA3109]|uniref:Restriction endonuclease FokI C-terminal domain-containing protein n=1 Tax=Brevibacterium koreense TaxID=3140787 RepID=A0AAU7UL90_9MICO